MKKTLFYIYILLVYLPHLSQAQKVTIEQIQQQCSGLPYEKRVRMSVSSFSVATPKATGQFGDELSQMLANALQNVNCFNVLLSVKDSKDLTDEISFGQAGNTAAGASPQSGKMKGPQVIVLGRVTEYAEGTNTAGALGIKVGGNKAHIGFIIQLVNAETREIIESKSIEVDGRSNGFKGVSLFGIKMAGSVANKAIADACEKGIIEAVEFISSRIDKMPLPEGSSGVSAPKKFDASNCTLLKNGQPPKIMVILPEFHITQRIPDPAGETEIIRRLVESGFPVVDAALYASLRGSARFDEAAKNPTRAIAIGREFGADIVIYGEAFSQRTGVQNNTQVSCRARVEVRAVKTDDAVIIASNGLEAGALDNAEFVAAKSALRSAGGMVADYLLEQFCSRNLSFTRKPGQGSTATVSGASSASVTEITVNNADYAKMKPLLDFLATKGKVLDRSIQSGKGFIRLQHAPELDLAELVTSKLGTRFVVKDFTSGKMEVDAK